MGEVAYDVDVDASIIARGCPGMSGADLQNLVNQVRSSDQIVWARAEPSRLRSKLLGKVRQPSSSSTLSGLKVSLFGFATTECC
jgi:hypothetical protein